MRVPSKAYNVSGFICLTVFSFLFLVSCELPNDQDDPDDEIVIVNDSTDIPVNDPVIELEHNPYFPLDTRDVWIYRTTTSIYDDEGSGVDTTLITYDTIQPEKLIVISNHKVRRFRYKYFNTQSDKIVLLAYVQTSLKMDHAIPILYTDVENKSWSYIINTMDLGALTIEFNQSFNEDQFGEKIEDEIVLLINGGEHVFLSDYYLFKKDTGIIKAIGSWDDDDYTKELLDYQDN